MWDKVLELELMGQGYVSLYFERYQQIALHRIAKNVYSYQPRMRMLIFPHRPTYSVMKLPDICQSGRQKKFLNIVLICIFPAMNQVEHVFIDIRVIPVLFSMNYLCICFDHFLSGCWPFSY